MEGFEVMQQMMEDDASVPLRMMPQREYRDWVSTTLVAEPGQPRMVDR